MVSRSLRCCCCCTGVLVHARGRKRGDPSDEDDVDEAELLVGESQTRQEGC